MLRRANAGCNEVGEASSNQLHRSWTGERRVCTDGTNDEPSERVLLQFDNDALTPQRH